MKIVRTKLAVPEIDLTSVVDILFILLIFTLLTWHVRQSQGEQEELALRLPASAEGTILDNNKMTVTLPHGEPARLNGERVGDLFAALKQVSKRGEIERVLIQSDERVPMKRFVEVISYLRRLGIRTSAIAVRGRGQ
jgi:biopolymer transport protein ExbD